MGFSQISQNEHIFLKLSKLFAHFDKNILILRKFVEKIRIFIQNLLWFLSVCVWKLYLNQE